MLGKILYFGAIDSDPEQRCCYRDIRTPKLKLRSKLVVAFALCGLLLLGFLLLLDRLYPLPLPDESAYVRVVQDRYGAPLRVFAGVDGVWRYKVVPEEVSPRYLQALLNYEDRWFYRHPGINPLSLLRALSQNLLNQRIISGGSTITMQVARLLDPHPRTLRGKARQMLRALQLEWHLDKRGILTLYINHAPFGGNLEGVEAASRAYLGHSAGELSHAEAALLAVMPQSPARFRPDRNPEKARRGRDKLLQRMEDFAVWAPLIVTEARQELVVANAPQQPLQTPLLARRLITHQEGSRLHTTIDSELQRSISDYVHEYTAQLPKGTSAAVMVMENADGAVRAYIGSAAFADPDRFGYVDMVMARRSPGSTLKPFLYGLSLDEGLIHSHSLLSDTPRSIGDYRPGNFKGAFSGPVSAQDALQRSLNLPAVQLLEHYGPGRFDAALRNAGLEMRIPGNGKPNLSLILGGSGVRLEQLMGLYASLARGGQAIKPRYLESEPLQPRRLLSEGAAWILFRMLADNPRGEFAPSNYFRARGKLAWKTGTSYGFRDAWSFGVSSKYTIGVWVGRPDGTPSPGQNGALTAAPLLFAIASGLQGGTSLPTQPANVTQTPVCWPLGTAKVLHQPGWCHTEQQAWTLDGVTPPTLSEHILSESLPNPRSLWVDQQSGLQISTNCINRQPRLRRVVFWPKQMEPWLPKAHRRKTLMPMLDPDCPLTHLQNSGELKITGIEPGARYKAVGPSGSLPLLSLQTLGGVGDKYWFVNGRFHSQTRVGQTSRIKLNQPGPMQLTVVDSSGELDMLSLTVSR